MGIGKLTSRDALLRAIRTYDEMGQAEFLTAHGFGQSDSYNIEYGGTRYESKAIAGVAYGYQFPEEGALRGQDFSQGPTLRATLERLGFPVKASAEHPVTQGFVTSRSFRLPDSIDEMNSSFWFNLWKRPLWPAHELGVGAVLYWYETPSQQIVWKTVITEIEAFEYKTKRDAAAWLSKTFDEFDADQRYFAEGPETGYCLAMRVDALKRLGLKRPVGFSFPQQGWLRLTEDVGAGWLVPRTESQAGPGAQTTTHYRPSQTAEPRSQRVVRELDLEKMDRGRAGHVNTLNRLAEALERRGIEPLEPLAHPFYDLSWKIDGSQYVAEIKSLTATNETQQMRLGLGQVLHYRHSLREHDPMVQAVLVVEREPDDPAWAELCESLGVVLVPGENIETFVSGI